MKGREQIGPDVVQNLLHISYEAGQDQNGVLLREGDHVLTVCPVKAEAAMLAAPDLIAVALLPVGAVAGGGVINLSRGCLPDPFLRKNAFSIENAVVQIKKAQLGDVFRTDVDSPAAAADPLRRAVPADPGNAQGFKEPGRQVGDEVLSRDLLDDGGKDVGRT